MTALNPTKILALATLTATLLAVAAPSWAGGLSGGACKVENDDPSSLIACYQRELDEKTKANDKTYREIVKAAKQRGKLKKGMRLKGKAKVYAEFIESLNETVIESRKSALRACVHKTAKFQDRELSDSAIANCRTEAELELEKQLKAFEIKLTLI